MTSRVRSVGTSLVSWSLVPGVPARGVDTVPSEERRWARWALLGVAVVFGLAQLVLLDAGRPPNWDEIVYVSQTAVGEPAVFWDSHRARGLALLVAPAAVFDPPFVVIRSWMVLVASAGLFAGFAPWLRRLGGAVPLAALLFAFNWVAFYFATEIYPNYPTAIAVAAASGLLANHLAEGERRWLLGAAAWLAVAALIRPADAILVGVGAVVAVLVLRPRASVSAATVLAAGGLVGILPWFAEGMIRFDTSPIGLFTIARGRSTGGVSPNQLPLYIKHLEGPLRCVDECRAEFVADPIWSLPPPRSLLMLVVMALLALIAWLHRPTSWQTRSTYLAAIVAIPIVAFYSKAGAAVNLRYLVPVAAVMAFPVAAGAVIVWRGRWRPGAAWIARSCLVVLLALWLPWQATMGATTLADNLRSRERARILGQTLADRADGRPCAAATQHSYPQIQYWSPCVTVALWTRERNGWLQAPLGRPSSHHDLRALAEQGYQIYVLSRPKGMPESSPAHAWDVERLTPELVEHYRLWTRQPDQPLPPDPRVPSAETAG